MQKVIQTVYVDVGNHNVDVVIVDADRDLLVHLNHLLLIQKLVIYSAVF